MIGAVLVPPVWRLVGAVSLLSCVALGGVVLSHQRDTARIDAADARLALARERADRQEAIAAAVALVRVREQHLVDNLQRIQDRHDAELSQARADAGHSAAAADRLRRAVGAAGGAIRRGAAGAGASAAGIGTTADALAVVVEQCVERYRAVASAADAGHAAGQQCERAYGAAARQVTR